MYNKTIGDAIRRNIFRGFNTTVLSYGQMNSGKTYSMYGSNDEYNTSNKNDKGQSYTSTTSSNERSNYEDHAHFVNENDGIAYRAIHDLFMAKQRHATGGDVVIKVTVIELYNDRFIDLLGYKKPLKTSSSALGSMSSSRGLTSFTLKSPSHARQILQNAFKRKKMMRSHTVCTLQVTINPAVNRNVTAGKLSNITSIDVISAKLTLVDLAGSESPVNNNNGIKEGSYSAQQRRTESSAINKDLFVLSQCITALAEKSDNGGKTVHVPFRDSKLTTLLRGSLGGNCCTVMIACVSPDASNLEDSLNTLRYAERTRNITNRVKKNMMKTTALTPAEAAALRRENKVLKSQLLDMTRKYQFLRRGRRISTLNNFDDDDDDESAIDMQDNMLFSPTNSSIILDQNTVSTNTDKAEAQRWRLKFEKLAKICQDNGVSTKGAEIDEKDEAVLVSHQIEILELKEILKRFVNGQGKDAASVASGLTFETFDFPDDQSTFSGSTGSSFISSIASRSLKSELVQAEYIGRAKMMETEDKKLEATIQEKKTELNEIEKTKILRISAMKLKLEKEQSAHDKTISELKVAEEELKRSIETLDREKTELEGTVNTLEEQLHQKEMLYAQQMKDNETNLNQVDQILSGLRNQLSVLEDKKKSLETEIEKLGESKSSIIQEQDDQAQRMQTTLEVLKSQVKSLTEEKLVLCSEVEDLQNASRLVVEYSEEQMERQKCEEKLAIVEREVKLLKDERGALQEEVAALQSNNKKQTEKKVEMEMKLRSMKDKISFLENVSKRNNDCKTKILQDRTSEGGGSARPPLPSPIPNKRWSSPSPSMRSFDGTALSTISISNLPDHFHFPEYEEEHKSILFGDGNESFDQDQKSVYSCFSENSSLNSKEIEVRMHAQRLLFWAERSISRKNNGNDHTSSANEIGREHVDKENVDHVELSRSYQQKSVSKKVNHDTKLLPLVPGKYKSTKSSTHPYPESLFSDKSEHTEFFLPKLGMASNVERKRVVADPKDLSSFLRSWQVNFLKSIGVRTAGGLTEGEKRYANDMAKAMKKWRHQKRMKPARTKSCLVALQIWSKVAKSVLQTAAAAEKKKSERRRNSSRSEFDEFPFENELQQYNGPMYMEVGVRPKSTNEHDDDCSFASVSTLGNNMTMNCMDDSLSLMEGEFEI